MLKLAYVNDSISKTVRTGLCYCHLLHSPNENIYFWRLFSLIFTWPHNWTVNHSCIASVMLSFTYLISKIVQTILLGNDGLNG